jgi:hypothetical protein
MRSLHGDQGRETNSRLLLIPLDHQVTYNDDFKVQGLKSADGKSFHNTRNSVTCTVAY